MADQDDSIDYSILVREALREVPRAVLRRVAASGLPGDHHFFVTFRTDHPGTGVPNRVRYQHPTEMTVVLQHQFSGLVVADDGFGVTLRFGGRPESIFVPFAAITAFVDPSAQFGLRFEEEEATAVAPTPPGSAPAAVETREASARDEEETEHPDSNVVEIGRFRRK